MAEEIFVVVGVVVEAAAVEEAWAEEEGATDGGIRVSNRVTGSMVREEEEVGAT